MTRSPAMEFQMSVLSTPAMMSSRIGSCRADCLRHGIALAICLILILAVSWAPIADSPLISDARGQTLDSEVIEDGRVQVEPKRDLFDVAIGVSQLVGALAAALGIPFIALQVKHSRDEARNQRTSGFQEKYQSRDFLSLASRTIAYFMVEDAGECIRKIEAFETRDHADHACLPRTGSHPRGPKASANDVNHLLSFFEDLATAYNRGDLSKEIIIKSFALPPAQVFAQAWWFICWKREGKLAGPGRAETELYMQYEHMVRDIRASHWEAAEQEPAGNVRVLCIPRGRLEDPATWLRARHLSRRLSEPSCDLAAVHRALRGRLAQLDDEASGRDGIAWRVITVPSTLEMDEQRRRNDQMLGTRLEQCLSRLERQEVEAILSD